jgi:hypothetical protein
MIYVCTKARQATKHSSTLLSPPPPFVSYSRHDRSGIVNIFLMIMMAAYYYLLLLLLLFYFLLL